MFLVDTNVLLDIFTDDAKWRPWSERAVGNALATGIVAVNPVIYAETSLAFADAGSLDRHLNDLLIVRQQLPYGAAFRAGRAFLRYRRAGGARSSPLPDFYIGAHAEVDDLTLLTRDAGRFRSYFPSVTLVTPQDSP
ncbi:MAG: type II toxin-antitoxin system VapC family toxin [Acidobacteriota bacterium]|nr:type II toxin-antitoxin system VapC family toxin [Acidobacteriota bacterium]